MSALKFWSIGVAIVILSLCAYAWVGYTINKTQYKRTYHNAVVVMPHDGVVVTGACVKMTVTFTLTDKVAVLEVNNDKMSGIPVKVAEDGGIHVKFADNLTLIFYKQLPMGYEPTKKNELLIIVSPQQAIILTQHENCEEITALLEQVFAPKGN